MLGLPATVTALLFDLDGVLTDTARVHAAAWKQMFDAYLRQRAVRKNEPFVPFDVGTDYQLYVDGKPRYDGVRSFLASRGITLPEGDKSDPPTAETVAGLGNRKNDLVLRLIRGGGVEAYPGSVRYLRAARAANLPTAVVSSSSNAREALAAAGIADLLDARVDGITAEQEHLKGKPAPDTFLAGAKALGVDPAHAAVFEDALAGVEAGRAGGFGAVIGVDRVGHGHADDLRHHGAPPTTGALDADLGRAPRRPAPPHPADHPDDPVAPTPPAVDPDVIENGNFPVEPWAIRETRLDLRVLAQSESLFALANGHLGLRGNLEEGDPHGLPGTYLNGLFESRPLPYAEAGYGYPEAGQTVINVTNGKIVRMLVDDEPFDVRYGTLRSHERVLDLRAGVLRRKVEWVSPAGQAIRVSTTRLVSFVQRSIAAVLYEVEAVDDHASLVVQSELVANEALPMPPSSDPRAAAALTNPLQSDSYFNEGARAVLVHRTRASHLRMAAGMDHTIEGPPSMQVTSTTRADLGRVTVAADIQPGERLRLVKFLAYGWSSRRTTSSVRDQVEAALSGATHAGWDRLLASQRRVPRRVLGTGRHRARRRQRAAAGGQVRPLPHPPGRRPRRAAGHRGQGPDRPRLRRPRLLGHRVVRAAGAHLHRPPRRRRRAAVAAPHPRPGPGPGDPARPEGRSLPVADDPGRGVLRLLAGRYRRLPHRRRHRRRRRPVRGGHRRRRLRAGGGPGDPGGDGPPVALPRPPRRRRPLPNRRGHRSRTSTAPSATTTCTRTSWPSGTWWRRPTPWPAARTQAKLFGVDQEEAAGWRDAGRAVVVPYDEVLGVHAQAERFTDHEVWDFEHTPPEKYPLLLHFPYFDLYRKQVVKQADLVMALFTRGDAFTAEQKARDFEYYEALTVRDSSLSACVQAVVAAEVGHLELAHDYFGEAGLMDLGDLQHNTRDGLHIASLAGAWLAAVAGFGGMRDHGGKLSFAPRLPQRLSRLAFRLTFRGRRVKVDIGRRQAQYSLLEGEPLETSHHGQAIVVKMGETVTLPVPDLTPRPRPPQPPGREPARRTPAR